MNQTQLEHDGDCTSLIVTLSITFMMIFLIKENIIPNLFKSGISLVIEKNWDMAYI